MAPSSSILSLCPRCGEKFDPGDVKWTCPACGHTDLHWSLFLNCEACHYNPDNDDTLHCPHCSFAIKIMSLILM